MKGWLLLPDRPAGGVMVAVNVAVPFAATVTVVVLNLTVASATISTYQSG